MTEQPTNPATPPADNQAQGPAGGTPQGAPQPPASGNDQTSGGANNNSDPQESISTKELNDLRRKAGRFDALQKRGRQDRRNNRNNRSTNDYNADNADPELLDALKDRDTTIDELSSANIKLAVKDKVRDLLDSDEYKDIPQGIRRAIVKNPLGFATAGAHTVDDAVADIQDYLDDELDNLSNRPAQGGDQPPVNPVQPGQPAGTPPAQQSQGQTPPASGSGPSSPQTDVNQGTEGKTGSKRSTQVLQNILKGPRK